MDFKDKKITVMGLGLLGRGLGVVKFLADKKADLIVTDLKTKNQLKSSLDKLKKYKIKYVLGKHRLEDFKNRDMVIKAAGVPLDSKYIKEARKNKIPIEMDASLFTKLAPVRIIGVTGTRGKSTVANAIFHALKKVYPKNVFLGGNIKGMATIPLLKKVKENDIVVLELDSWQLQGFGDSKISPNISVFTNFLPDHMNYYKGDMNQYFKDKANIFKYQGKNDYLIVGDDSYKKYKGKINSKIIKAKGKFKTKLIGEHNQKNICLAVAVLKVLGISEKHLSSYEGEPGRLEFVKKIKGVSYYNDTNSTTPDATIAALNTLGNVILLAGGNNKNLKYDELARVINKKVKALALFKGKASNEIFLLLSWEYPIEFVENMKQAINFAKKHSKKGDIILLSPGATSFGIFENEYDRGDQFIDLI